MPMDLQGQSPEIAHHFFDLWQDSLENQLSKMLGDHRPCHYAIDNGSGQVIWVPKHTPCWFESQSGKLIIDTANGSRWLPTLHNGPAKQMQVCLTSAMGMEEPTTAVPGLNFPRRQAWQKLPPLELNLSDASRADCCPLARVRIYTEELRALRTAVQLMVKRSEEKSAAQSSLQPSTSVMEPIQEGGSEADGSGSSPAEEATPEDDPPRASEPHSPAKVVHAESRSASPVRGCGCFGFGSRRPANAQAPDKAADRRHSQSLDEEPPSTPRASEKAAANRGTASLSKESLLESANAAPPGSNEDDSAMLFYHETSHPAAGTSGGQAACIDNNPGRLEREERSQDDSAMAFETPRDASSSNSPVHPAPINLNSGASSTSVRPTDSPDCPTPPTASVGAIVSAKDAPSPESAVRQKRATGASLPALLLSTAQAVGLGGLQGFSHSVPIELDAREYRHTEDCDAAEGQFLDTARGPRGAYRDDPRSGQQAAQLNGHMSLPVRSHVWDAARMVAESREACKEVWAPGYDHSPELSENEDHPGAAPRKPSDVVPRPALADTLRQKYSQQQSQRPVVHTIPPPTCDNPFQLPPLPIEVQVAPVREPESPAEEQPVEPTLAGQPSMEFVTAAMTKLGSVDIFGQGMGNQGGMLPSQSVKLAHLVLRTKEAPVKACHSSATPGDILQMRKALGRFPETDLSMPPNGQALRPLLAAEPAQVAPKLLMQPALSLVDWTNVPVPHAEPPAADQQGAPAVAKQRQPYSPRPGDAGNYSNSDVEIDSPFASNSLPREGQQSLPRRIIKYAGTSDIIYEDLNNPFDKHRGPARARRNRKGGKRTSIGSKGSGSSRSKSPSTAASPAQEPDRAGSPASRLSLSASASETPAQSTDASPTPSPAKPSGMALRPAAAHAHAPQPGHTPMPDASPDDSKSAEGAPQTMSSQNGVHAEQVLRVGAAVHADGHPAHSRAAAAPSVNVREDRESALHPLCDDTLTSTLHSPAHPGPADAAEVPILQAASTPDSITPPGVQPAKLPKAAAIGVSEALTVHEPHYARQAQRQDSALEGETYYDAVPVQASVVPLATAAASSAVPVQASPSMQIEPRQAEAMQRIPSHPEAQPEEPPQMPELSEDASTAQISGAAKPGMLQTPVAAAGSMQSTGPERHVAVNLRVKRPKPLGMVAAAIAALGLSTNAQQAAEESIRVRITPLHEALPRSRVALDPEQMDATWYSSLLMSSASPARVMRQSPGVPSSSSRAPTQRAAATEDTDMAKAAAARLTEAGKSPKNPVRRMSSPAQEAGAQQDDPIGGGDELPGEVATPDEAAAVSSAPAIDALAPASGASSAGPPVPTAVRQLPTASNVQKLLNGSNNDTTTLTARTQGTQESLDIPAPTVTVPCADAPPDQRLAQEQPDKAAAMITPANRARDAAMTLRERIEGLQKHKEPATPAGRTRSAALPSPQKPRWERLDQASAAATLGGGATLARCASDAVQQAQRNRALVSELKHHLETSGPRPNALSSLLKRKQSSQPPTNGVGSPHERGLLYKPELHSVADRVRYIERAHSRNVPPLSALTTQSSLSQCPAATEAGALQDAA